MKNRAVVKLTLLICVYINAVKGRYIGQTQTRIQQANTIKRNPLPQWNPSAWLRAPVPVARQRTTHTQEARAIQQNQPDTVRRPTSTIRRRVNISKRRFGSNIFTPSRRPLNRNSNDRMLRISLNLNRPFIQRSHNRPINHRIHINTAGSRRNIHISHSFGSHKRRPTTSLGQTNSLKHPDILNSHLDSLRTNKMVDLVSTTAQTPIVTPSNEKQTTETKMTQVSQPDFSVHVTGSVNALLPPETGTIVANTKKMATDSLVTIPIVETIIPAITKSSDVTVSNMDKQTLPVTFRPSNKNAPVGVQSPSKGTTGVGSGSALLSPETNAVVANSSNKIPTDNLASNPKEEKVATLTKSSDVNGPNSSKQSEAVNVQKSYQDVPVLLESKGTTVAVSGEVTTEEPDTPDEQDLPDDK